MSLENLIAIAAALVFGLVLGFLIGRMGRKSADVADEARSNWWEARKQLTGTQLQILQFMESEKQASISALQEKFSFIPDRELYYRLEQICLMSFLDRSREGEVIYTLNPDYAGTVEDDKTVMLGDE